MNGETVHIDLNQQRKPFDRRCPLCQTAEGTPFYQGSRAYFRCPNCFLIFVLPYQFLPPEKEKLAYDQHKNSPNDPDYRRFLARLFVPVAQQLRPRSTGLDFGSGPGPTLSVMFEEAGHLMSIYDPFYAPESTPFQQQYDFITASEVVEHLHQPRQELDRLWSCLKPKGVLGIMTQWVTDPDAFPHWYYKIDPTHVCFFSVATFQWLADYWQATLTLHEKDVVLFTKTG